MSEGKPAATLTSNHVCPKTTGTTPHVGGPVVTGSPNVFIGGMPAARKGDKLVCVGPPDTISEGSATVFINGKPAARLGDGTSHGGKIVVGNPTVTIGDSAPSSSGSSASTAAGAAVTGATANRTYGGKSKPCGGRDATESSPYVDPNSADKINDPTRKPRVLGDGTVAPLVGTKTDESPIPIRKYKERGEVSERAWKGKSYAVKKNSDGFPEFTIFETHLDDDHIGSGNEDAHFQACNERLAELLAETPSLKGDMGLTDEQVNHIMKVPTPKTAPQELTWHHHEDIGRMQLVDEKLHARFGHTGGMSIWGGGRIKK